MKRLFLILMMAGFTACLYAQPAKRRVTTSNAAAKRGATSKKAESDRAALMFPVKQSMPEDVVWKRDVYRTLDLTKDANAPLYYPVEPRGRQVNLFTYVFHLMLSGRVDAYTYKLDGVESFDKKDKMEVRDVLDRYGIYYEEKDGKFVVESNDVPSAEVTRYYIKESVYLDQRTGTFSTKVTAICPVLMRGADDFGGEATPYPLFWLNYDEIAPWLSRLPVMASNLNNVTNMTVDDYFAMNRYDGKIYKTNNMQGLALANYCKTDSAMVKEQKRIEKEIYDFEEGVWGHMSKEDSIKAAREDSIRIAKEGTKTRKQSARRSSSGGSSSVKAPKQKSSGGGSAPRVSVRRQRR
ncbi:MAG: gliding motility protein GldN [Bacteroidaceae bacterium]|nr:gliding motility protein GldN [Bacteroidaceae bacterium]MBQ3130631.1 gliding motility protein GldN [Bacteroidaceae bacterium]